MDQTHVREIKPFNTKKPSHHHHTFTSLRSLFFFFMLAITFTIFCTSPLRVPSLKLFLSTSLPNFCSIFFAPRFLFFLGNVIVIFLVRGSKINYNGSTSSSSSISSLFLSQSSQVVSFSSLPTTTMSLPPNDIEGKGWKMNCEDVEEVESEVVPQVMVGEHLRKRADSFIAKVNRQIMFEYHDDDHFSNF